MAMTWKRIWYTPRWVKWLLLLVLVLVLLAQWLDWQLDLREESGYWIPSLSYKETSPDGAEIDPNEVEIGSFEIEKPLIRLAPWQLAIPFAIIVGWFFWRDREKPRSGQCQHCRTEVEGINARLCRVCSRIRLGFATIALLLGLAMFWCQYCGTYGYIRWYDLVGWSVYWTGPPLNPELGTRDDTIRTWLPWTEMEVTGSTTDPDYVALQRWGIPLWMPGVILVSLAGWLIWRHWSQRRRFPAHHCQKCGYSLTGNISGICPECGTPRTIVNL